MVAKLDLSIKQSNVSRRFSIRIRSVRLSAFLAMLRIMGYAPNVTYSEECSDGLTNIVLEMGGSENLTEILSAWLRTIPGVEAVITV